MFCSSPRAGTLSYNAASSGKVAKRMSALHLPAADGAVGDGLRLVRTSKWQIRRFGGAGYHRKYKVKKRRSSLRSSKLGCCRDSLATYCDTTTKTNSPSMLKNSSPTATTASPQKGWNETREQRRNSTKGGCRKTRTNTAADRPPDAKKFGDTQNPVSSGNPSLRTQPGREVTPLRGYRPRT